MSTLQELKARYERDASAGVNRKSRKKEKKRIKRPLPSQIVLLEDGDDCLPDPSSSGGRAFFDEEIDPVVLYQNSDGVEISREEWARLNRTIGSDVEESEDTTHLLEEVEKTVVEQSKREDDARPSVVYRSKEGKKISKEEWAAEQERNRSKRRRRDDVQQQKLEWGSGLVQKQEKEQRKLEADRVAAEPFTRYEIDTEHDKDLRNESRWGDPLASSSAGVPGRGSTRPKCRFAAPENRFGITPGYRWDGVIRGTGFEEKLLQDSNKKKMEKEESYKWMMEEL